MITCLKIAASSVNVLLPMHETEKLLGLRRELSFLRDGVLNRGEFGKLSVAINLF